MDAKRLTPNKIANLVMAEDAWHDSEYVRAEDYDVLRAEVERLRADAERLDWLDARGYTYGQSGNETPDGMEWRIDGHTYSLRDAIDAARGES